MNGLSLNQFEHLTDYDCTQNYTRYIGAIINISIMLSQLVIMLTFIIFIIKSIKGRIQINKLNLPKTEKEEKLKQFKQTQKKPLTNIIILSIIIFLVTGFFNISRQFAKPLIYLYPKKDEHVTIKLGKPETLTCTYPKYINKWEVLAKPNGNLIDLSNGRTFYGLYWEGINSTSSKFNEGFCVKGSETIQFLEEKLKILGLTEREANEFIIYWLPQLESNKYNLIRFQTIEEINEAMPLEVSPKPDTIIRIMMEFKPSNKYIEIKEQKLSTPKRNGFVLVEWGGTEI